MHGRIFNVVEQGRNEIFYDEDEVFEYFDDVADYVREITDNIENENEVINMMKWYSHDKIYPHKVVSTPKGIYLTLSVEVIRQMLNERDDLDDTYGNPMIITDCPRPGSFKNWLTSVVNTHNKEDTVTFCILQVYNFHY